MLTLCKSSNVGEKTEKKSHLVFGFNSWHFERQRAVFLMFLKCYILVKQNTQFVYFKKYIFDLLYSCKYPLEVAWVVQDLKEPCEIQPPIERELTVAHWKWIKGGELGILLYDGHHKTRCTLSFTKTTSTRRHCLFQTIKGGLRRGNPHVRCAHES